MRVWPRSNCRVRVHVTWFSEARVKPRVLGRIASRGVPAPLLRPQLAPGGTFPADAQQESPTAGGESGRDSSAGSPDPPVPFNPGQKEFFFFKGKTVNSAKGTNLYNESDISE